MEVILEKFNRKEFCKLNEKTGFQLHNNYKNYETFNISQGNCDGDYIDDECRNSPLWRGGSSIENFRQRLWAEICWCLKTQSFLDYLGIIGEKPRKPKYFWYYQSLVMVASALKRDGKVKLIYINDLDHAELIKRVILWLAPQI